MYLILYFYSDKKLKQILGSNNSINSPSNIFSSLIINITYILTYIIWYFTPITLTIIPMGALYSIYFSQLSYNFIDNKDYNFKNPITFYNSNSFFFYTLGLIYSYLELYYLKYCNMEILGLFLYVLVIFPILISYNYKNNNNNFNNFYISEKITSIFV